MRTGSGRHRLGRRLVSRGTSRLKVEQLEDRCLLSGGNFTAQPIIPAINPGMKAYLQSILAHGQQLGNRLNAFAKIGDSITDATSFLADLGNPLYNPSDPAVVGGHGDLAATIGYFRFQPVDGTGANSFNHISWAAANSWQSADLANAGYSFVPGRLGVSLPYETPLGTELRLTRPSIALIMIGTNDVGFKDPAAFSTQLMALTTATINSGVIPVLSTLPDDFSFGGVYAPWVLAYNQTIVDVADALDVPVWNYWLALQPLPGRGISADGGHPSLYPGGGGFLTDTALLYGYNMRNVTGVEVLDKLRRVVLDNGPADPPDGFPSPQTYQFVVGLYQAILGRAPDMSALVGWGLWSQVVSRQEVAQALWQSAEHRGLQVDHYYATYLHRSPSDAERISWVNAFMGGMGEQQIESLFLTSEEYQAAHGSDVAFVTGLYHDVLGRDPDPAGLAGWLQNLQDLAGGQSRPALIQAFLVSVEKYERDLDSDYAAFFHRQAGPGEQVGWLLLLEHKVGSAETVAEAMLTSYEFWVIPH